MRAPHGTASTEQVSLTLPLTRAPSLSLGERESENDEAWRTASALAGTVRSEELLDPLLGADDLLYRLFHEEGVWVYEPQNLSVGCRCSRERILNLLRSMPDTERADMLKDGEVKVHCQFCNTAERFTAKDLDFQTN